MQIKLIFTTKVSHLASFWKWDFLELGNGLLDNINFSKIFSVLFDSGRIGDAAPKIWGWYPCSFQSSENWFVGEGCHPGKYVSSFTPEASMILVLIS